MSTKVKARKTAAAGDGRPILIDAIEASGETDLEAIQDRIDSLTRQLDVLKIAARIIDTRLHGRSASAKAKPGEVAEKIYDFLKSHGPARPAQIRSGAGVPSGSFYKAIKQDWFTRLADGRYKIAVTGEGDAG